MKVGFVVLPENIVFLPKPAPGKRWAVASGKKTTHNEASEKVEVSLWQSESEMSLC